MNSVSVVLGTLLLNEIEWLEKLYRQHKDWPGLRAWVFVEAADRAFAEVNPGAVSPLGLSTDGTSELLDELARRDDRITVIHHGFCGSVRRPSSGKCEARQRYLDEAEKHSPDFLVALDSDEFYTRDSQRAVMEHMAAGDAETVSWSFPIRHPWRPPSIAAEPPFRLEAQGGFWRMPHCHWWRWSPGLRYAGSHNSPETPGGRLLNDGCRRVARGVSGECVHMAFSSAMESRRRKHAYYAARGEAAERRRRWYVESRAAWETWQEGGALPHGARVVPWEGAIPEVFLEGPHREQPADGQA